MSLTENDETADTDKILWGAQAIAEEINRDVRQTHYLLEKRLIPGKKTGKLWTSSRNQLRRHLTGKDT